MAYLYKLDKKETFEGEKVVHNFVFGHKIRKYDKERT